MATFREEAEEIKSKGFNTVNVSSMPSHPELLGCELRILSCFKGDYSVINMTEDDALPFTISQNTECALF